MLTVCESLSDNVRALVPDANIVQIEDAPLDPEFVEEVEKAKALRDSWGIGKRPVIVYTGNFEAYQGVDLLVEAAAQLQIPKGQPEPLVVMVGGTDEQVQALSARSEQLGLSARIRFTGLRPIDEMPIYMTLADILVSPRSEGTNTALKIYTYMQSGCAIVATNLETHTQVLDNDTAELVEATPASIAAGISRLLADPTRARSIGAAAKDRVESRYGLERFKRQVRELYAV